LIQNSSPYPCLAKTPAVTVATEKPRLAAQKSNPNARTRCCAGRSATAADPAGRNSSIVSPTATAAAQISGIESAEPSAASATAAPTNPTSIVLRQPIRSPSQPPSNWDPMSPTPRAAITAPAVAGERCCACVRYSTRNDRTTPPARPTNCVAASAQTSRGNPRRGREGRLGIARATGLIVLEVAMATNARSAGSL
jgi:hypothetical protein